MSRILFTLSFLMVAPPAFADYVCVARPSNVPPGTKPHIVQAHGFLRPDAERAVLAKCAALNGENAGCVVTVCTQYEY